VKKLIVTILSMAVMTACVEKRTQRTDTTTTKRAVQASLLSFEDFDLETVVAMVKQDKVKGAQELETFVNGDNGVNNVDIDKDGKIDYVRVVEGKDGQHITLDFVATPSSGGEEVTVANLKFSQNTSTNEMVVEGGYPTYVNGHSSHFYSYHTPYRHGMSMGDAVFLAWLMTPSRPLYYNSYPVIVNRPVYNRSTLTSRRTATRTTTKVGPVKSTTRPNNYNVKSAQKTQSRMKATQPSTFKKRNTTAPKQKATGFGATPPTRSTSKPKSKPKGTWGSSKPSRRSSPSRSRSWGGGSRRRSSIKYKHNVQHLNSGMEIVEKLQPVEWEWNNGVAINPPKIGFIAEDVAELMPELVYTNANGEIEGINYDLIVVPMINALKAQQVQIEELSNSIEILKENSGTKTGSKPKRDCK
jgi:hypothetical protein